MHFRFAYYLVGLIGLSACATMNEEQCQVADWRAIGFQAGAKGQSTQPFDAMQRDCAKHSIRADFEAFKRGHREGLNHFCTFDKGLELGHRGNGFPTQCSRKHFPAFAEGYSQGVERFCDYDQGFKTAAQGAQAHSQCDEARFPDYGDGFAEGLEKYRIEQEITGLEQQLLALDDDILGHQQAIEQAKAIITSASSTAREREQALEDLEFHQNALDAADYEYHELEEHLSKLQDRYNH